MITTQFVYLFTYWCQFVLSWFVAIVNKVIITVLMFLPKISIICIMQFFIYWFFLFSSVQLLSHVQLFVTPWTTAYQASLSIANCQSLSKLMSIELMMPSNHLILCHLLLLPPSIFPNIRVCSNESALHIRWTKYWSFSINTSPSNEHPEQIPFRMDCLDLLAVQGTQESSLTPQFKSINSSTFSFL